MSKILVVDDEVDILEITRLILTERGYEVVTCRSGVNIVEYISLHQPQLVLLDILMKEHSGKLLCKEIKKYLPLLPVVLFSASNPSEDDIRECGASGFISKPFDMNVLLETLKNCLLANAQ